MTRSALRFARALTRCRIMSAVAAFNGETWNEDTCSKDALDREQNANKGLQGCPRCDSTDPIPPALPALQHEFAQTHCVGTDALYCNCLGGCGKHPCDDGNSCTTDACDKKEARSCIPDGANPCGCVHTTRTSGPCDEDSKECINAACDSTGVCKHDRLSGMSCTADNNPCSQDVCQNGTCSHPPVIKPIPCVDERRSCQGGGICIAGTCVGQESKCGSNEICFCSCGSSTALECDFREGTCNQRDEFDGTRCTSSACADGDACVCPGGSVEPSCQCVKQNICPRATTTVTTSSTSTTSSSTPTAP